MTQLRQIWIRLYFKVATKMNYYESISVLFLLTEPSIYERLMLFMMKVETALFSKLINLVEGLE